MARRGRRLRASGQAFLVGLLLAAGCDGDDDGPVGVFDPDGPPPGLELVAEGLGSPVFLTAAPGDPSRLFVLEQAGRIRVVRDGALLPEPFLDLTDLVRSEGERGLLGLAFHPEYAVNGWFFVNYTDLDGNTVVARFTAPDDPDQADPQSALVVLEVDQPFANHNGGMLAFAFDGMLYIGLGDGGSGGDPESHGQNLGTLLGSILRIDVDASSEAERYRVPPDNPFVDDPESRDEIWIYGVRNPWRFSFDHETGDLYVADVGQSAREEVTVQPGTSVGGENFGWNRMEGTACFSPPSGCSTLGLTLPVHEYGQDEGCAITGGYVYRGTEVPALDGRYLFADFCEGWVRSFRLEDGLAVDVRDDSATLSTGENVLSFGEDAAGELYLLTGAGRVYRIVAG